MRIRKHVNKLNYYYAHPNQIFVRILMLSSKIIPNKLYLRSLFYLQVGYKLNLKSPQSYNEKLQWLKLHDKKDIYTTMSDKHLVKQYVTSIIGQKYIIPTISIYDDVEDININELPDQFVLKCTHDSGGVHICKKKEDFKIDVVKRILKKSIKKNYYYQNREWPYKNIKPRIICEKYIFSDEDKELIDYKFFCFDGKVRALFIATERQVSDCETKFDFFDKDFVHLPFTNGHPNSTKQINKPKNYEHMIELAEKLSAGIPHLRVDLYNISGTVYFGELTFFHWSGLVPFVPIEWDYHFGSWIKLDK